MPVFKYDALDAKGKEVRGEIEALSNKEAISKIRKKELIPTKVRSKGAGKKVKAAAAAPKRRRGAGGRVSLKYIVQFARQLSTLQDAGLSILRSLRILEQQHKRGKIKRIIGYVADDIEGGSTLSEALGKFPRAFNRLVVNMIAAGEVGGVLDIILLRLADFLEKSQRLKRNVRKAMVYPVVVLTIASGIVLFLMIKIIPKFSEVLIDMSDGKKELPALTQGLMNVSNWLIGNKGLNALMVVLTPFVIIAVLKFIRQFRIGRLTLDVIKLRIPIVGKLTYKISVARWTRTLGTLISAGVPILEALNITRDTAGNEVYARALNKVHHAIRQGDTFANPLRQSKTVDAMVVNMIDVGEETGDMDKMLEKIANNYDEETDILVASLMSLLEPLMVVLLGLIVGTIVIAMFLPMVTMMQAVM
ncbi:MAG: type II secretion system F family protein [Planctomycetota bacterium]|nr:MAG: type II secretion system F family protein [Planctomycetota bacterium]